MALFQPYEVKSVQMVPIENIIWMAWYVLATFHPICSSVLLPVHSKLVAI